MAPSAKVLIFSLILYLSQYPDYVLVHATPSWGKTTSGCNTSTWSAKWGSATSSSWSKGIRSGGLYDLYDLPDPSTITTVGSSLSTSGSSVKTKQRENKYTYGGSSTNSCSKNNTNERPPKEKNPFGGHRYKKSNSKESLLKEYTPPNNHLPPKDSHPEDSPPNNLPSSIPNNPPEESLPEGIPLPEESSPKENTRPNNLPPTSNDLLEDSPPNNLPTTPNNPFEDSPPEGELNNSPPEDTQSEEPQPKVELTKSKHEENGTKNEEKNEAPCSKKKRSWSDRFICRLFRGKFKAHEWIALLLVVFLIFMWIPSPIGALVKYATSSMDTLANAPTVPEIVIYAVIGLVLLFILIGFSFSKKGKNLCKKILKCKPSAEEQVALLKENKSEKTE